MPVFAELHASERGAAAPATDEQRAAVEHDGYAVVESVVSCKELRAITECRTEPTLDDHLSLDIEEPTTWPTCNPLCALVDERKAYRNREGAQLQTSLFTTEYDVLDRAPALERALGDGLPKWTAKGHRLERLHVRLPRGLVDPARAPSPPAFGWHIERGAGDTLRRVAILHLTDVLPGGGGVTVVRGSHKLVRKFAPLLWPRTPYVLGVVLANAIAALARLFTPDRLVEVRARAGGAVVLDPFIVHSSSRNQTHKARLTYQMRCDVATKD